MSDFQITPESFRSKMTIPPKLKKQYEVAVRAGLRFMFDEGMREATLEFMDGQDVVPKKIADGVTAVVLLIAQESNGTFPGELVIPVGVELIAHAVDVAQKAGMPSMMTANAATLRDRITRGYRGLLLMGATAQTDSLIRVGRELVGRR